MKCGNFYTLTFFFFLHAFTISAQVAIKVAPDRYRILIGEPVTLSINGYFPLGVEVTWNLPDSLPHFEYLEKGKIDTIESIDGKKITQTIKITSFDSGRWEIPSFRFMVGNKAYYSDTVMVDVAFTPFDPDADYRDIKDIEDAGSQKLNYIPWIIGIGTIICFAVIYLLSKKKPAVITATQAEAAFTAFEEAMRAMAELRKKGWPANGEVKLYYTLLNQILREFLSRKLKIPTQDKTNEELIVELKQLDLPSNLIQQIAQALRMSDFVKFAKYQPAMIDNQNNYNIIESAIKMVNNIH